MTPIIVIEVEKKPEAGSDAGYVERLQRANEKLRADVERLRREAASNLDLACRNWSAFADSERAVNELRRQLDELGRKNVALAAQAEQVELLERQLETADTRIDELEAALTVAQLPAESRANVIDLVRRAA